MNPESLPSALSDLFLPEAVNPSNKTAADRGGQGTSSGSAADADRFEQYLSSARRSVMTDQALPAPAAADEHLAARADARRQPVERADRRNDRPTADRDDRRPVDDRAADTADRKDPAIDRDRTDRTDDDRRVDDDRDPTRSDDRVDANSDRGDVDDVAESDAAATGQAEASDDETTTDGIASALAAALDPEVDLDGDETVVLTDAMAGPVDPAADLVDLAIETETTLNGDQVDDRAGDQAETSLLDAQLDRATDPNATVAAAAAATTDADDLDEAGTDDLAIDLDGADADLPAEEADPVVGTGTDTDGDAGLDLDLTDGDRSSDGASDDGGQPTDASAIDRAADAGQAVTDGAADDGQVVAPVAGPVVATNSGPTATTGQPVTGVDAVAGPAAPRNRTTTGAASTQAGQQAQAPLADGEAGDPLWLQVRRAMGSLRTLQNGEQQMTIRLRPAELGSVMVRVNAGENGTTVSLIADSAVAATQLTQQRQQLISELEQGGLAGVAVDVGTGAETDLRDGATDDRDPSNESEADGSAAAAAVAGASAGLPRTGGRGRRAGGSSGSLVDVEL